jgi:lipopolysaccharide transport system permease protein
MKSNNYYLRVEAGKTEKHYWKDLWRYRELFLFLSWRDILVRYKQTVIGIAWSILRPLLTMIIFTIVFGNFAKLPSGGIPYPVLVFSGMIPWQFFSNSFSEASNSLIASSNLISKIYFPRIIIPVSSIIVSIIDLLISFILMIILMIVFQFAPSLNIVYLPIFLVFALITSLGISFLISSLNVKYRDFRYIVPFIIQFGLYISPVGFSSNIVPEKLRIFYSINPMVGVIDCFRWAITGKTSIYMPGLIVSVSVAVFFLFFGIMYFRKTEKSFADII